MKKSWPATLTLLVFLLFLNGIPVYSQIFTDELRLKLPKSDQYKLLKAETFNTQGNNYLQKAQKLADSLHLTEGHVIDQKMGKDLDDYYSGRIKASYFFRNENGLLFSVVDKHIREFWKKNKDEKKSLELILKMENAAYDSLVKGDKLRETAERKLYLEDKIPLVAQAEIIESDALIKLQKVLYIYLNWPSQLPDLAWLYSEDTMDPFKIEQSKEIHLSNIQLDTVTTKKDTITKSPSLYSLMHISESQIDRFNEFLKEYHPDKMETYLIDFQKLYDSAIDSLHKEWRKYLNSGVVAPDTLRAASINQYFANKDVSLKEVPIDAMNETSVPIQAPNKNPESMDFLYKVQISASRLRIDNKEQHKIYQGTEKINESFEDHWYKYTIGTFQTYNEACSFKNELKGKVKGVFVIAYFNGKRIKITTSLIRNNKVVLENK